jgi:hypothetical protein
VDRGKFITEAIKAMVVFYKLELVQVLIVP